METRRVTTSQMLSLMSLIGITLWLMGVAFIILLGNMLGWWA